MARFYRVERNDNGRLIGLRFEWSEIREVTGQRSLEVVALEDGAMVNVVAGGQRIEARLDAEELGALRRFLAEAERTQ